MDCKPRTDWKEVPVGTWLVKIDKNRKPYHIANVSLNNLDQK